MVEVIKHSRWLVTAVLGVVWLGTAIGSYYGGTYTQASKLENVDWNPYGNVRIRRDEQIDDLRHFYADFDKYECDIDVVRVAVKYPGIGVVLVEFEDVDGFEPDFDREPGEHTLRIRFPLQPDFEWYEIRTVHLCPRREDPGAEAVPLIFASVGGSVLYRVDN